MSTADAFSTYYADEINGLYDCVDRIVLNAYFPVGHSAPGFRSWWRLLTGGDETLDNNHLMRMSGRLSRRVHAYAKSNAIPLLHCDSGTRKHELAEKHLPTDTSFKGIFLILVARAKTSLWDIKRKDNYIQDIKRKDSYVNHYHFHIIDPEWGHLTIKLCGHPPFPASIMLNGHEWVEQKAIKQHTILQKRETVLQKRTLGKVSTRLQIPCRQNRL